MAKVGPGEKDKWIDGLSDLLRRAKVPVTEIRPSDDGLEVTISMGSKRATLFMVPLPSEGKFFFRSSRFGYYYRATEEDAALLQAIRVCVAILVRLESRLPLKGLSLDKERDFGRRFPFASVDGALGPQGKATYQVLVRFTKRCNQGCPFCSAPIYEEPGLEDLERCLVAAAQSFPSCLYTLTGGEPTLRKGWIEHVSKALATNGIGEVQVQTNGVWFASRSIKSKLPPNDRLLFFVSLHALDEAIYDLMTASHGQLPKALQGIRRLLRDGYRVIVNTVVGSVNARHLPSFVETLPKVMEGLPCPEVHISVLMCPPHRPEADRWLIRYEELVPILEEARQVAAKNGVPMSPLVSSTHASIPPCFVSPAERAEMRNRPILMPDETGYEDLSRPWVKAQRCRECEADPHCLGVPAPYARRFGLDGLRPFGRRQKERVLKVTRNSLHLLEKLVPEVVSLRFKKDASIVLDLCGPDEIGEGDEPITFTELLLSMPEALRAAGGEVVRIRSKAGRPACLLEDAAQEALLAQGTPSKGGPGNYSEVCGDCAARAGCSGLSRAYLERFGATELKPYRLAPDETRDFRTLARWLLVGRPYARIPLSLLVPEKDLPQIPCTRPWTRLELHDGGTYGPCCADYMNGRFFVPKDASPFELWNSPLFRWFRKELLSSESPASCRSTCPVLAGRLEEPRRLTLRGGSAEAVENQLRMVEALLEGRIEGDWLPTSLCVPVTSFCNYDCLMCECGETGTLDDQRPESFWEGLAPFVGAGAWIDANGGEPLASPVFRRFLEKLAASEGYPSVAVVTNGSYLTPRWLERLQRLPFRSVTISLNAATAETYRLVNRGLPWSKIRRNIEALLKARAEGRLLGEIVYSFVILKANLSEIKAFAEMAIADEVGLRYLLPQRNRNNQSIFTEEGAMRMTAEALREVLKVLEGNERAREAEEVATLVRIVEERLDQGIFEPIGNL